MNCCWRRSSSTTWTRPRAEVVVDIAVLEVSKNWERTLGIAWPSSVGVALHAAHLQHNHHIHNQHRTTRATTYQHVSNALRSGPPQGHRLCRHRRLGHPESAAHRLQYQDSAESRASAPPTRQKATMKIGSQDSHRHRLLPDRRGHRGGQLAGQHAIPVPGRGRQYRDDADRPLRPRCNAEDQDRSHLAERLRDHQRRHRAHPQPARRRPGDPPARRRGQHPRRHPG